MFCKQLSEVKMFIIVVQRGFYISDNRAPAQEEIKAATPVRYRSGISRDKTMDVCFQL